MFKGVPHAHLGTIWYHSEPSDVPYSPNQFLGWNFFCCFLQQDSSNNDHSIKWMIHRQILWVKSQVATFRNFARRYQRTFSVKSCLVAHRGKFCSFLTIPFEHSPSQFYLSSIAHKVSIVIYVCLDFHLTKSDYNFTLFTKLT